MNLERIKQILKKVNALIENLDDQGETSAIERDLLLRYLRDLYENVSLPKVISEEISIESDFAASPMAESERPISHTEEVIPEKEPNKATSQVAINPVSEATRTEAPDVHSKQEPAIEATGTIQQGANEKSQTTFYDSSASSERPVVTPAKGTPQNTQPVEAVINKFENPVQYFPPTEETTQSGAPTVTVEANTPAIQTTPAAPVDSNVDQPSSVITSPENPAGRFDPVFVEKSATDLADKYQLQSVVTIEGAMGINERMLTINELFGGEHNVFMETVTHINSLSDFKSARKYLIEGVAARFNWDSDERLGMASEFVQLVRRKFA